MKRIPLISVLLIILCIFCKREPVYYIGAEINGKYWSSKQDENRHQLGISFNNWRLRTDEGESWYVGLDCEDVIDIEDIYIGAYSRNGDYVTVMEFMLFGVDSQSMVFEFGTHNPGYMNSYNVAKLQLFEWLRPSVTDEEGSGVLRITDITDEYIEGEFEFRVYNPQGNTVNVEYGRFRLPIMKPSKIR